MGIVWEAYHKGVPLLGVPENPIDNMQKYANRQIGSFLPRVYRVTHKTWNPGSQPPFKTCASFWMMIFPRIKNNGSSETNQSIKNGDWTSRDV